LIGKRFSKNSKKKWFRRVETNVKCLRRLILDHLLAVEPCGLQAKKQDFQKSTVKSKFSFSGPNLFFLFLSHYEAYAMYRTSPAMMGGSEKLRCGCENFGISNWKWKFLHLYSPLVDWLN
jgi:hypothetical protein